MPIEGKHIFSFQVLWGVFLVLMLVGQCEEAVAAEDSRPCIVIEDNVVYGNNMGGIRVRGNLPVSIDGCEIFENGRAGIFLDRQSQVSVTACDIFDNRRAGINADKASVATIDSSKIHGNDNGGVRLFRAPEPPNRMEVTMTDNKIYANLQSGIRTMLPPQGAIKVTVKGNVIFRNLRSGIRVENDTTLIAQQNDIFENGVAGIVAFVSEIPAKLDIYQNRVAFNATAGIHVINGITGPIGIRNNWVFNNERSGILCGLWSDPDAGKLNVEIINNTVVSNGSSDQGVGIRNDSNGTAVVMNNIVAYNYITGIRTGECYDESYNLLFANGDIGNCCEDPRSAPYWIERTQFAGCPERGKGDLVCDPLFVDPDSYDFSLQDGSLAIDGGRDGEEYGDLHFPASKGTARNDMGATGGPYAVSGKLPPSWPAPGLVRR